MKILLKLRFNGSAYHGFQAQPDGRAIQNVLTDAFTQLLGFPCAITGCSRTDSGVHALGFCASLSPKETDTLKPWCSIPVEKLHRAANLCLPDDIAVMAAAYVPDDFHPRYNVRAKEYAYHIYDTPTRDPFLKGRAYHTPRPIQADAVEKMNEAASLFVGEHNFAGYMATGSKITDPVRHVYAASVQRETDGMLIFRVKANGFLYNMVRIMAGTLLECAYGSRTLDDVKTSIEAADRQKAGFTAPPEGLYLTEVFYDREIEWLCK